MNQPTKNKKVTNTGQLIKQIGVPPFCYRYLRFSQSGGSQAPLRTHAVIHSDHPL